MPRPSIAAAVRAGWARGNRKLGGAVLSWSRPYGVTCPPCELYNNGCYADPATQPPHFHPFKTSLSVPDFSLAPAERIKHIRLHVVGDFGLATDDGTADDPDIAYIDALERSARITIQDIWTDTHGWRIPKWRDARASLRTRIQILASCGTAADVRDAVASGWRPAYHGPDVSLDAAYHVVAGLRLLTCPAQRRAAVTCSTCRACWSTSPRYDGIAFADHC